MLSVGVPPEAVVQRVRADGLSTPSFRVEAHLYDPLPNYAIPIAVITSVCVRVGVCVCL